MSTPYTAPSPALRTGIDYLPAALLQPALDALAWRDNKNVLRVLQQHGTSNLTVTTSAQDLPGATLTFTPARSGAIALVVTVFAFSPSAAVSLDASGFLVVDGVAQARAAVRGMNAVQNQPATQAHRVVLSAASHTLKLQASRSAATGTVTLTAADSYLAVFLIDNN
ncbi:hypothetical protein [Dactylosporangium sp. CS-033363]|uniref:hypothetical protein n=1 Tax=Dactylosporangium sp. CS-033363 TaxID=3239935 RepID=UPI003D9132A1